MKRISIMCAAILLMAGEAGAVHIGQTDANGYPVIVPAVKKLVPAAGAFALPRDLSVTPADGVDLAFFKKLYAAEVSGGGVRVSAKGAAVRLIRDERLSPDSKEGYRLAVAPAGVEIRARTAAGLFYGIQTLGWMIRNRSGDALRCCTVDDWPDLKLRGIMFDCNMTDVAPRHVARLCEVMEGLAALKCNVAFCDFAEDLPLSISGEFNRKETLTKEDVATLRAAARRNHISIIPNLQCITHAYWISRHKDWMKLREGQEKIPWQRAYCPRNPEAQRIVETVVRETCDLFQPEYFSLNLDEFTICPYGQCPRCRGKDCAEGVIAHVKPIEKLLLDCGIRPIVAHDEFIRHDAFKPDSPFARCLDAFDLRTIVTVWLYEHSPSVLPYRQFNAKGRDLLFMSWMNFLPNTMTLPRVAASEGVPGGIVSYWGWMNATFDGFDTMPSRVMAGTVGHASCCWNLKAPDYTCQPFDCTTVYKQALAHDRIVRFGAKAAALSLEGAWTAQIGGSDRRYPAFDAKLLDGLARDVASDREGYRLARGGAGDRLKVVALAGCERDASVLPREVRLAVGAKTEGFSFLMAAAPSSAWVKKADGSPKVAKMTMVYADGTKVECPIAYDRDIVQWNECFGPRTGRIVARVQDTEGAVVNLSEFPWRNPKPDVAVHEIVFSSALYDGVAPILFAASTHGPAAPAAGGSDAKAPPDVSAEPKPVFKPLYDFDRQGLGGLSVRDITYANVAPSVRSLQRDARHGTVLQIVVPPPKDSFNRRVMIDVPVPKGMDVRAGTFGMDVFCDRPEAIARADMYLVGTPGVEARIVFDRGYGFLPGWTHVNMPTTAFTQKEKGGANPGTVHTLRFGFFLGNDKPVTFRFADFGFSDKVTCSRFDVRPPQRTEKTAALESFVRRNLLPYGGGGSSSSGFADREIDALDAACDERWCAIRTRAEYDAYRLDLRRKMLAAIGTMPERTPLNARTVAKLKRDGYTVEKVIFESMPGLLVTANLFVPDGSGRRPAVVMSCGHADDGKDCKVYRRACVLAVKRGFVALMFDPYEQGERVWQGSRGSTTEHTQMGLRASLLDWSAPLLRIWDGMRAIDYALSRPEVDPDRLGYMGQSGGGTMTALMEAADDRIRAAAPSCYLTSLRALCHEMGPQDGEQNIFGQLAFGLNHTGYVLIPDIPVAVTCKFSDMFPYSGVRTLFKTVRTLERNVGLGERAYLNVAPGPHGWTESTETASVNYLARHLLPGCRNLALDREADWTLDLGFDISKAELGLTDGELGCTPSKSTQKAGSRHIYDILAARFAASASARQALDLSAKRARAAKLAKVKRPAETGYRAKEIFAGEIDGVSVVRLAVQYPVTGHTLPTVCLSKPGADGDPVLIADFYGRAAGLKLAKPFVEAGRPVMLADVSGVGELSQPLHVFYGRKERPDEGLGAMCYLMGEPLVGRRATDLLVLADVLGGRCGGKRPLLIATGPLTIPASHAFAADAAAFAGVKLESKSKSWFDVLRAGAKSRDVLYYADLVPTAALSYDWTELAP